jgi:DnaK suppressor protein
MVETYDDIRSKLLHRRDELKGRVSAIAQGAGRGKPLDPDFEEQAVERQSEEVLDALDVAARRELAQIGRALDRMDRGIYGICACCGEAIPVERLRAVPYTDLCVSCAEDRGKGKE